MISQQWSGTAPPVASAWRLAWEDKCSKQFLSTLHKFLLRCQCVNEEQNVEAVWVTGQFQLIAFTGLRLNTWKIQLGNKDVTEWRGETLSFCSVKNETFLSSESELFCTNTSFAWRDKMDQSDRNIQPETLRQNLLCEVTLSTIFLRWHASQWGGGA